MHRRSKDENTEGEKSLWLSGFDRGEEEEEEIIEGFSKKWSTILLLLLSQYPKDQYGMKERSGDIFRK